MRVDFRGYRAINFTNCKGERRRQEAKMTPERGKRWLFDRKIFWEKFTDVERGVIGFRETSMEDFETFIQSEVERNRKEAVRDFAEKLKTARDDGIWIIETVHRAHHEGNLETCRNGVCASKAYMFGKIKAALKELDA